MCLPQASIADSAACIPPAACCECCDDPLSFHKTLNPKPSLQAGGYPSWTLGEDVRLGVELQRHGYTGYFLPDRLAVGEVPDTVRGVFMQRSRCAPAQAARG